MPEKTTTLKKLARRQKKIVSRSTPLRFWGPKFSSPSDFRIGKPAPRHGLEYEQLSLADGLSFADSLPIDVGTAV